VIANVEMAAAWDGPEGDHWADNADRYESTDRGQWERLVATGVLAAGRDVLDVGCGTGRSARQAARLVAPGAVVGVDLSARMLERGRRAAATEGLANITFVQADVQTHPFEPDSFDVTISSYGAMFFADPIAAFANIGRALRPGGRLALLAWRELASNEWLVAIREALAMGRPLPTPPPSLPGPFGLADPGHVREMLGAAGFTDVGLEPVDAPIRLGADAEDAFAFLATFGITKGLTHDLDEATTKLALDALRDLVGRHASEDGVLLGSASWLITARRN
jgi:SAM-dependent methyltransferase